MNCPVCGSKPEKKVFATFTYEFCPSCKEDVEYLKKKQQTTTEHATAEEDPLELHSEEYLRDENEIQPIYYQDVKNTVEMRISTENSRCYYYVSGNIFFAEETDLYSFQINAFKQGYYTLKVNNEPRMEGFTTEPTMFTRMLFLESGDEIIVEHEDVS